MSEFDSGLNSFDTSVNKPDQQDLVSNNAQSLDTKPNNNDSGEESTGDEKIRDLLRLVTTEMRIERSEIFHGPLPPPEILRKYNEIVPGSASMIFGQFEAQGNHRRELEKLVISRDVRRADWGLFVGAIVALVGVGGAIYLMSIGYTGSGLTVFLASLGSIVASLVYVSRKRSKERDKKEEAVPDITE